MKLGYVQQIDTPMNLYNEPYNKFVAGFIGSPQMNFFDVTLKRNGDWVTVTFSDGDEIRIPYERVCKIHDSYLHGDRKVIFGIRPEHVSVNKDGKGIRVTVTGVERLGNEMNVYAKIGSDDGEFTMKDEGRNIVMKVVDRGNIQVGDVVYVIPDEEKLHFFDAETEITLMNKIPPVNSVAASSDGGRMTLFGGQSAKLPEVFRDAIAGRSSFELEIPPYAIVKGGDFRLKVARIEKADGKNLAYLADGDHYIFALVDDGVKEGDEYAFGFRNEKIGLTADGAELLRPLEDEERFPGTFSKTEVRENKERVLHFFYNIGGYSIEAAPEQGYKINSIDGNNCYKYKYEYAVDREKIQLAESGGLKGTVAGYLDYGNARFAKVDTEVGQTLIRVDRDFDAKSVNLAFDSGDVSVYSTRIDMKLC